jgi:hypothetical protein
MLLLFKAPKKKIRYKSTVRLEGTAAMLWQLVKAHLPELGIPLLITTVLILIGGHELLESSTGKLMNIGVSILLAIYSMALAVREARKLRRRRRERRRFQQVSSL